MRNEGIAYFFLTKTTPCSFAKLEKKNDAIKVAYENWQHGKFHQLLLSDYYYYYDTAVVVAYLVAEMPWKHQRFASSSLDWSN